MDRTRWLDDVELDDELKGLLRAAPVTRGMTAAERARSARRLRHLGAVPAAAGAMFWFKNVALAGVLGAFGGLAVSGLVVVMADEPAPAAIPPAQPPVTAPAVSRDSPRSPAPPAVIDELPPSIAPAPRSVAVAPVASSASEPEPERDSLAQETRELERARSVLTTDPAHALRLVEEQAREFPRGKLGAERELVAIDALRRAGRTSEARARAEAMLARQPRGLYAKRLSRMLEQL
jgi:hypothetical protein